eukprot:624046-Pleurochrysis_carterae.AAC.1
MAALFAKLHQLHEANAKQAAKLAELRLKVEAEERHQEDLRRIAAERLRLEEREKADAAREAEIKRARDYTWPDPREK